VAFPDEVLAEGEEVVLHLHPHGKAAVRPVIVLLASLGVLIMAWVMLPPNTGGLIGVCLVGAFALFMSATRGVWPLLVWRRTHYVFTDERILLQDGVIAFERRDLPFNRINDYQVTQSFFERLFTCGTLTVASIGERSAVLRAVPGVQRVQTTLYELIETDRELRPEDYEEDEEKEPEVPMLRQRGAERRSPWRSRRPANRPPRR
jgi:uncharacterized membrane protein YdbT with pleckstrin-like domain